MDILGRRHYRGRDAQGRRDSPRTMIGESIVGKYLTPDQLRRGVAGMGQSRAQLSSRNSEQSGQRESVFISHSSKDNDIAEEAADLLIGLGANVYVDIRDGGIPMPPGPELAEYLRERIAANRKLIVILTSETRDSVWVPWELGLAEGYRERANIAIWPVVHYDGTADGQEYIRTYSSVQVSEHGNLLVGSFGATRGELLTDWLRA